MEEARPPERTVVLHRQDEPLRALVQLILLADGTIRLHSRDTASAFWGGGDYEFWIELPPDAQPLLLKALLAEMKAPPASPPIELFTLLELNYTGEAQAVPDLTALCKREGIPHIFESRVTYAKS